MTATTRTLNKRKMLRLAIKLQLNSDQLVDLAATYEPSHIDIFTNLMEYANMLKIMADTVESLAINL